MTFQLLEFDSRTPAASRRRAAAPAWVRRVRWAPLLLVASNAAFWIFVITAVLRR